MTTNTQITCNSGQSIGFCSIELVRTCAIASGDLPSNWIDCNRPQRTNTHTHLIWSVFAIFHLSLRQFSCTKEQWMNEYSMVRYDSDWEQICCANCVMQLIELVLFRWKQKYYIRPLAKAIASFALDCLSFFFQFGRTHFTIIVIVAMCNCGRQYIHTECSCECSGDLLMPARLFCKIIIHLYQFPQ